MKIVCKSRALIRKIQFLKGVVGLSLVFSANVMAIDVNSKQAILIDLTTHAVLFQKNPDEISYPSSMTKMMTAYIAFEELKAGRFMLDQSFPISENAWRKQGSKMFLPLGQTVTIRDLLKGIVIASGNDASICLAEGVAGTEESFAEMMTKRAHEMGAVHTVFKNASGWPDPEHVSTVRDLAIIAERTIVDFPEYYGTYKETEFTYHNIHQENRNPLLYANLNADGLKTGHTDLGGYGLAASTLDKGRRLLLVINGAESKKARADDAKALIRYGYNMFDSPRLFKANSVVETADVWQGEQATVDLVVDQDVFVTVPRQSLKDVKVTITHPSPIEAPFVEGTVLGSIVVQVPGADPLEIPLKASMGVEKAGILSRLAMIRYLFWGHN